MYKLKAYTFTMNTTHFKKYTHILMMGWGEDKGGDQGCKEETNINKIKMQQEAVVPMMILCSETEYITQLSL